jgi:hypothetical protein
MHFVDGVPPEYYYVTDREDRRRNGGLSMQRMTLQTWLETIEKERELGTGHLLSVPYMPRPKSRGICECDVCTRYREANGG